MRLDRSGVLLLDIDPFEGSGKIVALVYDPADSSVWVASKDTVAHVRSDGYLLQQLDVKGEIQALALYADVTTPEIAFTAPEDGTTLSTSTPTLQIHHQDSGSGAALTT